MGLNSERERERERERKSLKLSLSRLENEEECNTHECPLWYEGVWSEVRLILHPLSAVN